MSCRHLGSKCFSKHCFEEIFMPAENLTPSAAPSLRPSADRDSIYWSKERWRIIAQRLGPMSIQYLLIDSHHDELVAQYPKMSAAMDHRDRLLGRTVELPAVLGSKCEELAHE
jgi:hypothetical protein